jgi:hypothetical protein
LSYMQYILLFLLGRHRNRFGVDIIANVHDGLGQSAARPFRLGQRLHRSG